MLLFGDLADLLRRGSEDQEEVAVALDAVAAGHEARVSRKGSCARNCAAGSSSPPGTC